MAKKVRLSRPAISAPRGSTKDRLIAGSIAAREGILDAIAGLSPDQQERVFLGEWSVRELLAHLIGWDHTYIAAFQDLQAGELPGFYAAYDADWQSYNLNLVREYDKGGWPDLVSAVRRSHTQVVDYMQTLADEEFGKDWGVNYGGTPVTIARLVEAETEDEREHLKQINQMKG